jgi:hypothetical protein
MAAKNFLSFAAIAEFANNGVASVSPIGEISNKSKTYSKDQGIFTFNDQPSATVLHNFVSLDGETEIVMPVAIANKELEISNWLVAQTKAGNISNSRPGCLALLKTQFTAGVEILDIGEMVTNNRYWMPSFVTGNHIVGAEKQRFYLWFADEYFKREYPRVAFAIVHPVALADMDSLMNMNYQEMAARLALETPDVISKRMHEVNDNAAWPVTDEEPISFEMMDLINTPRSVTGWWHYAWWGNGVDAQDILFEQMRNEILKDSKFPLAKWEEKIPDLFNPIEFYVLPFFNRKGLLNKTNGAREYSPIVDNETRMALVDKYLTPNMTQDHVIKSTQFVPFLWKSIAAAFVGKVNNREGTKKIYDLFSDYSLRPSGDSSFGQMNLATMEFVRQMENLLAAAEVMTDISLPLPGITRVTRFGKMYAARRVGKVKYLVMTKWQMQTDGVAGI